MKKKELLVYTITLILVITVCFELTYIPRKIINIDPSKVSYITIHDGNTGKFIKIIKRDNINHIINNLSKILFKKDKCSLGYVGCSFNTTIYEDNGKVYKEFYINSNDTVRKDPYFYRDDKRSIDYDYIESLIHNQN